MLNTRSGVQRTNWVNVAKLGRYGVIYSLDRSAAAR